MKYVIGIDAGGSTTKIIGIDEMGKVSEPLTVTASDPISSIYGAFGKFNTINHIALPDVTCVTVTGVGAPSVGDTLSGVPCHHAGEFNCVAAGGLELTDVDRAIVVSIGTGTALVYAERGKAPKYLGGTGVGGGTLMGLAKHMIDMDDYNHILELAKDGDLARVDLRMSDVTAPGTLPMPDELTAANFAKTSDLTTRADLARGIVNMVFETIGMLSVFAAREHDCKDVILTGTLADVELATPVFKMLGDLFHLNFIVPDRARFATALGAALEAAYQCK